MTRRTVASTLSFRLLIGEGTSFLGMGSNGRSCWSRVGREATFSLSDAVTSIRNAPTRLPAETSRRLWTMLAHLQGSALEIAHLARGLGIDVRTTGGYLDLRVDLLLVRRLPPWHANVSKAQPRAKSRARVPRGVR